MLTALTLALLLQAGTAQAKAPDEVRLIRAEVGPSGGMKGGTFVLDEQRESFDVAADKEVVVAFE